MADSRSNGGSNGSKVTYSFLVGIVFAVLSSAVGIIAKLYHDRIGELERWRSAHEEFSRDQVVSIQSELRELKVRIGQFDESKNGQPKNVGKR